MSPEQITGLQGEQLAAAEFEKRGWTVKPTRGFTNPYDFTVGKLPVEVKMAYKTYRRDSLSDGRIIKRPRWQFFMNEGLPPGDEYILVLIAVDSTKRRATAHSPKYFFILPGSTLAGRTHVQLTSHPTRFRGWLSQWLNRWKVVEYLNQETYLDGGPVFEVWEKAAA